MFHVCPLTFVNARHKFLTYKFSRQLLVSKFFEKVFCCFWSFLLILCLSIFFVVHRHRLEWFSRFLETLESEFVTTGASSSELSSSSEDSGWTTSVNMSHHLFMTPSKFSMPGWHFFVREWLSSSGATSSLRTLGFWKIHNAQTDRGREMRQAALAALSQINQLAESGY